jgi:anti-anti-sigma factor
MKTESFGPVLRVSGLAELSAPSSPAVQFTIHSALRDEHQSVEIDSSTLRFVDCAGLRALVSLHRSLQSRKGSIRLVQPTDSFLRLLKYTQLHHQFEIISN